MKIRRLSYKSSLTSVIYVAKSLVTVLTLFSITELILQRKPVNVIYVEKTANVPT